MTFDRYGMLWVLCNGALPDKIMLNWLNLTQVQILLKKLLYSDQRCFSNVSENRCNGQTLYYLDNGVRKMDIGAKDLPAATLITPQSGQNFYKIGINPIITIFSLRMQLILPSRVICYYSRLMGNSYHHRKQG